MRWRWVILALVVMLTPIVYVYGRGSWYPYYRAIVGRRTVEDVLDRYGEVACDRLRPRCSEAGLPWPPAQITLIAFKAERRLELWGARSDQTHRLIHVYPIRGCSGGPGPKLTEGDRQVPEGSYVIESLNPNSSWHLSMRLNYPNAFDLARADEDGRSDPGSDIFIHGKSVSVGCLAMGDDAIEELFVLVAAVGTDNARLIITPTDPRARPLIVPDHAPAWTSGLYDSITAEIRPFVSKPD